MSTVIKDGAIVTADRTYKADVLVENGRITKIGEGFSGNETLDADRLLRHARRDRPAHASRNAVHGNLFVR